MDEFRVALFGPQATHWTLESLSNMQSALVHDDDVDFLKQTLLDLPSLWPLLEKDFAPEHGFSGLDEFKALQGFATGARQLDPQSLTNTQLAPLTVLSHVLDFIQTEKHKLSSFQASQGFCIGFLSAAALSSANGWAEFKANLCNAVRLAACIGVVVDLREASLEAQDRATTISVRWKTAADRAYLEICLDLFQQVGTQMHRDTFNSVYQYDDMILTRVNLQLGLRILHH